MPAEPLGKRLRALFSETGLEEDIPEVWSTGNSGHILMILVDANRALVRRQPSESVWTTTITIFEIRFGLALLASGRWRDRLYDAFDRAIDEILSGCVLPFDRPAAERTAAIAARRRVIGRTVDIREVQIAGIAAARKVTLAMRNIRQFENLGVVLVDGWQAPSSV